MATYALIMAGGRGERLWPLSRADRPKQFLPLLPDRQSLLQATFARVVETLGRDQVYVVTGARYVNAVLGQIPGIRKDHVIVEPASRDTGPCLVLGTSVVLNRDPDATILALPSDHYVADQAFFRRVLVRASQVATETGSIVTIGIRPNRPETTFGYLLRGDAIGLPRLELVDDADTGEIPVWKVNRFVEKPDSHIAEQMLRMGGWYWNSGVFCFPGEMFLRLYNELLPQDSALLSELRKGLLESGDGAEKYAETFTRLTRISVDYAIMEKTDRIVMVPGEFGWDDVGGWRTLERIYSKDTCGNVVVGRKPFLVDSSDCVFYSVSDDCQIEPYEKTVAAFGLRGIAVVDAGDVMLLTTKEHAGQLKSLLDIVRQSGAGALLETSATRIDRQPIHPEFRPQGKFVAKPWGYEVWWAQTAGYLGKVLFVRQGESFGLQYHRSKTETMLCLSGTGSLTINDSIERLTRGKSVTLDLSATHRLEADTDLTIVEVSTPEADDTVSVSDEHGRSDCSE